MYLRHFCAIFVSISWAAATCVPYCTTYGTIYSHMYSHIFRKYTHDRGAHTWTVRPCACNYLTAARTHEYLCALCVPACATNYHTHTDGQTPHLHTKIEDSVLQCQDRNPAPPDPLWGPPFPPFWDAYHLHNDLYKPNIASIFASPACACRRNLQIMEKSLHIHTCNIFLLFFHATIPAKGKRNPVSARPRMAI